MANNKMLQKIFLILLSLLICSSNIFSQENIIKTDTNLNKINNINNEDNNSEPLYEFDETGNIIQKESPEEKWQFLEWTEEFPEYVGFYEIIIEKFENNIYTELLRLKTESNETQIKIQPLLPPGIYRTKIITYNLLDFPAAESDYDDLIIYAAAQPIVNKVTTKNTKSSAIYLEEINDGIFIIDGKNLFTTKEDDNDIQFTEYMFINTKTKITNPIIPEILEIDTEKNNQLIVKIPIESLDTGLYGFFATDASGLVNEQTPSTQIEVKFKKPIDLDLSFGWTCPIVLSESEKSIEYYIKKSFPLSFNTRMTLIPFKHNFGYLGFNLTGNYTRIENLFSEKKYTINGNIFSGFINFVYQLPFRKQIKNTYTTKHIMTLDFHFGLGVLFINDLHFTFNKGMSNEVNCPPYNCPHFAVDAGIALQIYFTNRLYIEPACDFIYSYLGDTHTTFLQPIISLGWQF